MRVVASLACVLMLSGCERAVQRQPARSDHDMRLIKAEWPGMTQKCLAKFRWEENPDVSFFAADGCFEMEPARRWRGLWRTDFELSRFCPAPASKCGLGMDDPSPMTWLSYSPNVTGRPEVEGPEGDGPDGALYAVEFIGRQTAQKGSYGHLGGFEREIVIDRMIWIKKVGGPEPSPVPPPENDRN